MSDCECGSPFGYEMTTPMPKIEGNGMFVYPECPRKRWIYVSTGDRVSVGIAADNAGDTSGYLYAWGDNRHGCIGNGTYDNSSTPVLVDSVAKWKFATTDGSRVFAIKEDGSLWGWGQADGSGCLGTGPRASRWQYPGSEVHDFSSILSLRAKISSSVEYVVPAVAGTADIQYDSNRRIYLRSQQNMGLLTRRPRWFWVGEGGGFGNGYMAPPSLQVKTFAVSRYGLSELPIGSGCVLEPIFEAEVVGLISESSTWASLGMMPTVTSGGSGYTSPPTVTISGGGGAGATAKANIANGSVVSIELLSGGRGYQSRPAVEFSGGGGTGAAAEVYILGGVYGARVVSGGSGYTSSVYVPHPEGAHSVASSLTEEFGSISGDYYSDRVVCVTATAAPGDDFHDRRVSRGDISFSYLNVVGVCGLSPSPVVAIESPNVPISDVPPEGYLFGETKDLPLSASVHIKRLTGDDGAGATATASSGPVEYGGVVPYRRIVVSLTSGGFGYRAEPRIIVGERATPELIDAGEWSDVAIHSRRAIGAKSDGSIWVWGLRIAAIDWWAGGNYSEVGDASPVRLGRWIQLKGYKSPEPDPNATPPTEWSSSGLGSSGGVVGIQMPSFQVLAPWTWRIASVPGYTTAPSLTPVGSPANKTFSFTLPPDANGNPRSVAVSGFGSPTAELDGPASARRVYSYGGYRYVIDTGGVLWKLGDGLSSISNAPGEAVGYRSGAMTTVSYGTTTSGAVGSDEKSGSTVVCDTPPNPNTSTTTGSTTLQQNPERVTHWRVYGGSGLKVWDTAKVRLQWEDQTLTPSTTTSTSEEVWSGVCTVQSSSNVQVLPTNNTGGFGEVGGGTSGGGTSGGGTSGGGTSNTLTVTQTKTTTVVTHGVVTPTSGTDEPFAIEVWGEGLFHWSNASAISLNLQSVYDHTLNQWRSPSDLGVVFETHSQDSNINRGGSTTTYARCGGTWKDYCPQLQVGILEDGSWMCKPVFAGYDDIFFAGLPMPADFSQDLGQQQKILPGGLVVDAAGRLWRLPIPPGGLWYSPFWNYGHRHGTPPARLAAFSATATNSGSGVVTPPVVSATQAPLTATATASFDGKLYAVGVIDGGSGYASPPTITFQGGGGSGGAASAVIEGPLADLSLGGGGSGYRSPPDVVFTGIGIPAKANCSITGGVSEIRIASGGYGYYTPPTVTIEGDGQGATATAEIQGGGRVDEISLRNSGSGYTSTPTVVITGGGGSGASAEAVVDLDEESENYGKVTSLSITSRGLGYTSRPDIEITGGGGAGAKAEATIASDGVVISITINSPGINYTAPPHVRITGGGGSGALATAIISGSVSSVGLTKGGKYRTAPTFSFRVQKEVSSLNLTATGNGYLSPPSVLIVGGQGDGASAVARLESTLQNAAITVVSSGSGYTSPPKVTFTGGGGEFARGTATVSGGVVTGVTVTEYGSGFFSSPAVYFTGGGGEGAAAVVKLPLDNVSLISGGSGYTSPPVVLFFGGGGDGAAAEATIADMPGSGGGGTSQINGSVIFVDVTSEGSNYQSHPIAIASPPQFPWGQTAAVQAKIVGTVTGINVISGGDKYRWVGVPAQPEVRGGWRFCEAEVYLRGTPCGASNNPRTSSAYVYGPSGYHSSVKVAEGGAIGSVSDANAVGDTQLYWNAQPLSQVYYYSKPEVCFNDTVAVDPVAELQLASVAIGKDFRNFSFGTAQDNAPRAGELLVRGVGDSPLCTSVMSDVAASCLDDIVAGEQLLFTGLRDLFRGNRYSTPPTVELVDVVGSGAALTFSLDQDGFVVEHFTREPILTAAMSSSSPYSSEMGLVLSGGVPLLFSPSASCTIDSSGSVSSVTLSFGGGGFSRPPLAYVTGGGGTGASVAVEMGDEYPLSTTKKTKKVVGLTLLSGGSGYSSAPQVVFVAQEPKLPELSSTSADAVEDITLYGDRITRTAGPFGEIASGRVVWLTNYKFFKIERLRFLGRHNTIYVRDSFGWYGWIPSPGLGIVCAQRDPLAVTYAGSGYAGQYLEHVDPPPNSRPLFVPFFSNGRLVGGHVSTLREGSGQARDAGVFYRMRTHTPTMQTYDARANQPASAVKSVQVLSGGAGYTYPPSVRFTGGGGAGAAAVATINSDGAVVSVGMTSGGWGYTSQPTVSFSGDGGGAFASAFLDEPPSVSLRQVVHDGVAAASDAALEDIGRHQFVTYALPFGARYKLISVAR